MNLKLIKYIICTIIGTLVIFAGVSLCFDDSQIMAAERELNKLRFERINVYLNIYQ